MNPFHLFFFFAKSLFYFYYVSEFKFVYKWCQFYDFKSTLLVEFHDSKKKNSNNWIHILYTQKRNQLNFHKLHRFQSFFYLKKKEKKKNPLNLENNTILSLSPLIIKDVYQNRSCHVFLEFFDLLWVMIITWFIK